MEKEARKQDNNQSDPKPKLFTYFLIPLLIIAVTSAVAVFVPYDIYLETHSFLNQYLILFFPIGVVFGFLLFFFPFNKIFSNKLAHELRKEKERARAIISSMGEGLLVVDNEFKLVLINPAAEKILEVSAADYLGNKWADIVSIYEGEREIPFSDRTTIKTIKSGEVISTTVEDNHYYKIRNGKMFPVASVTAPLWEGNVVMGAVKVFRDATQEKENKAIIEQEVKTRTQELLKKNLALEEAREQISRGWFQQRTEKARLLASIESLPRGYILTDLAGNIVLVNSHAPQILGAKKRLVHLSDVQEALGASFNIVEVFEKSTKHQMLMNAKDISFGSKFLEILTVPIYISKEESPIGVVILLEDVTEAKTIERSKDEFFSIASHELRTPLSAIRGNTALILDYYKEKLTDKNLEEMVEDIHESSVRLISIVNDFLDLSRLEQKRAVFKIEDFDIKEVISKIVFDLKNLSGERNLSIRIEADEDSKIMVSADKFRTEQVIYNLLGNSLKFTEKGGVVFRFKNDGKYVTVEIEDTGKGISLKNQPLLFRKFQQAGDDLLTRDNTRGTGLGLYICKLTVEGMGGKIYLVKSEEGKGATFAFTLSRPQLQQIEHVPFVEKTNPVYNQE